MRYSKRVYDDGKIFVSIIDREYEPSMAIRQYKVPFKDTVIVEKTFTDEFEATRWIEAHMIIGEHISKYCNQHPSPRNTQGAFN